MERKKKRVALYWGIIGGIGLLTLTTEPRLISQAETEIPQVIINELAWAGSSSDGSDEWIELKNTTDIDIPITGWQLTKYIGSSKKEALMLVIPADVNPDPDIFTTPIIPKQGYFLISHYGPNDPAGSGNPPSVLNVEPDYKTSSVILANESLQICLYDGPWNDGRQPIDTAGNKGKPFYPADSSTKISMERNAEYAAGDLKTSWHEATAAINLDEGVIDKATPKADNSLPAAAAPKISKIIPDKAEAETIWDIEEILGENFVTTGVTQIKLEKGDLAIWGTNIKVMSPTSIDTVKFDLHDAEAGKWDLVVINPDGQFATLPDAVEITEPEEELVNPTYSGAVAINELYPHPATGIEEFIELYNSGDTSVNLKSWKLDDQSPGGSAEYTITADTILGPHQYLIFPKSQTHIYLNDTGDYARLIQPNGTVIDTTPNYGKAATGYSYSKINSNWQWTKRVTPNTANLYESIAEEDETDDEEADNSSPDKVTIKLESDSVTANAAMLIWQINWPGAIGDLKIYQSDKSGQLGYEVGRTNPPKTDYRVTNLLPKTKYFFTVVGTYNVDDIKSNQITFTTTTATGTNDVSGGTTGTPKQIVFSELLPNPNAGENEFIELYNPTDQDIDIAGWKLQDASGRTYVITAGDLEELAIADVESSVTTLPPHQYLLLEYPITRIRLNNSGGEEVALLDAEDTVIDKITYAGSAKQGYAYVLAPNEQWFWSNETTPGEANDISFAGIINDSGAYLVDSGWATRWPSLIWISLLISAIIGNRLRKYGYTNLYHP